MDQLYELALKYLPPNLQALVLDPPSLARPTSWLPVVRAALPYTSWIVGVLALYVLYALLSGLIAHVTRFVRFALRIGPVIGLIAWLMSGSGQGGMGDVVGALREYAGLGGAGAGAGGQAAPGIAALKDLLGTAGGGGGGSASRGRGKAGSGGGLFDAFSGSTAKTRAGAGGRASRKQAPAQDKAADAVDAVQDYVKDALVKAAGLEWLLGGDKDDKRKTR